MFQFEFRDEKQKEFSQRTFKTIMVDNAKTFEELAKIQEEHYEVHEVDESF